MKHAVEQTFYDLKHICLGWGYRNFDAALKDLIYEMRDKIGNPFIGEEYHNLRFVMNVPLYREFCIICQTSGHDSEWCRGIKIMLDPTLYIGDTQSPVGIVRLIYEEPETIAPIRVPTTNIGIKINHDLYGHSIQKLFYDDIIGLDRGHGFQRAPHIDHVIFNNPATIVFWKDGTKTVVKWDADHLYDRRQAILYAFIRKIYGEGRPYHDILNEIEEAVK